MSIFNETRKRKPPRSTFDLSHDVKLSLDMGKLIPTYLQEIVPGDKVTIQTSSMFRMAPLISPVMHQIHVFQEYFFVPNRILWGNWESFITGSRNGKQLSTEDLPSFPRVTPYDADFDEQNGLSSLMDYFGLPPKAAFETSEQENINTAITVSALPFAAYQRVFDEYYRDENLVDSIYDSHVPDWENYNQLQDGVLPENIQEELFALKDRAWEHDYFTSALPWAQKGEAVTIPIDLEFQPEYNSYIFNTEDEANPNNLTTGEQSFAAREVQTGAKRLEWPDGTGTDVGVAIGNSNQYQNTSTINDLRAAYRLQEWLETNARGGTRYFESIWAHFNVRSPDSRLQRPEFIGSQKSNMIISEVLQTSSPQGDEDTPQANMSGNGISVNNSKKFQYTASEHGYIIGITSILPRTAYMQGMDRMWNKTNDRLDYYWPAFAHLGEQAIRQRELYIPGDINSTFGYTPRYSEYKFINSRVAGDFRDTLNFWHLARRFETDPALNADFIQSGDSISKRIYAVQDLPARTSPRTDSPVRDFDSIYAHIFHKVRCNRKMPKYGTPTL